MLDYQTIQINENQSMLHMPGAKSSKTSGNDLKKQD